MIVSTTEGSVLRACMVVAIVRPALTAKRMAERTKAIVVNRCQRSWWWWFEHVGPGVGGALLQRERPASEVGEVLTQQVQVGGHLVEVALAVPAVAPPQFVHNEHDPGCPDQDRSDAGEDRSDIHSRHKTSQPSETNARPAAMTVA